MHSWPEKNPRGIREVHFQRVWGTHVWSGLFNGHLIVVYKNNGKETLTGQSYLYFLSNMLPDLMENNPLQERRILLC